MGDNSYKVINVDINDVLPNRFQPRIQFNEEEILELSDSIKEHGVIQPLVVRSIGNKYEIIAGERRYKASVLAGLDSVPVIVKELNDKESAEIALIENIQRKNLSAIEEAISYKKIIDMSNLTQEDLAKKIGKSQSAVANKIRLLNLSDEVQDALLDNKISERHARSLLRLKEISKQNQMLEKIINERLTVRKTDEEINKILSDNFNIEEEKRGEINMNNEINTNPTVVIPPSGNFDIFGGSNPVVNSEIPVAPVAPVMPEIEAVPEVTPEVAPVPSFGMNTPVAPVMPEIEAVPEVTPEVAPMPSFGMNTPVAPVMPEIEAVPEVTPEVSPMPNFGMNTPVAPVMPEIEAVPEVTPEVAPVPSFGINTPVAPVMPEIETVPEVSIEPIVEPQIPDLNSTTPIIEENATIPELTSSPIIVTDYSKQYDPIMPQQTAEPILSEKSDFKEVVNIIRECSAKIEQYGYKIDLEEYDLSSIYQVIFKIEK